MNNLINKIKNMVGVAGNTDISRPISRVLVPVAGFPIDTEALEVALKVTSASHGQVFAVYVAEIPLSLPLNSLPPEDLEKGEKILSELTEYAKTNNRSIETELLLTRSRGDTLINESIEREVDLIIMGIQYTKNHGEFELDEAVNNLLQHSPKSVWILRESTEATQS
ncbi:MAG: universal stress protein [Dehalococcoidia bacterium]